MCIRFPTCPETTTSHGDTTPCATIIHVLENVLNSDILKKLNRARAHQCAYPTPDSSKSWPPQVAFTELPPALSRLTRLRTLAAGGNPLPALPPWLPALSACLTHLDVSRSRELRVLPDTTSHLTSLTRCAVAGLCWV